MGNPLRLPLPELLLRIGLAFSFIYPAAAALIDPYAWVGYFPGILLSLAGTNDILMLHVWGVFELFLAAWIVFGRSIRIPSLLMALALAAVVVVNPGQFPILFRDVSIALMAGALYFLESNRTYGRA